jgi:hypothetical protein
MRRWIEWKWTSQPCPSGDLESSLVYLTPDIAGPRIPLVRRGEVMAQALRLTRSGAVVVVPTKSPDILGESLPERLIPALLARTQAELDVGISKLATVDAHCRALWLEPSEALDLSFALAMVQSVHDDPLADVLFQSAVNDGLADGPMLVNWVVVDGGEEPVHPRWVTKLRDDCAAAEVPFTFRSWGSWQIGSTLGNEPDIERVLLSNGRLILPHRVHEDTTREERMNWGNMESEMVARVGRFRSGALLDGVAHDGRPEAAR